MLRVFTAPVRNSLVFPVLTRKHILQTVSNMPRPAAANFVDSFFTRTLFQDDDEIAASVLATELAADADIKVGVALPRLI